MRRLLVTSVAAVLVLVPVSAAEAAPRHAPSQSTLVRRTVVHFYAALQQREGKRACALLTRRIRREIESIDQPGRSLRPCPKAIVAEFGGFRPPHIISIRICGSKAWVKLVSAQERGDINLMRQAGVWKLDEI